MMGQLTTVTGPRPGSRFVERYRTIPSYDRITISCMYSTANYGIFRPVLYTRRRACPKLARNARLVASSTRVVAG